MWLSNDKRAKLVLRLTKNIFEAKTFLCFSCQGSGTNVSNAKIQKQREDANFNCFSGAKQTFPHSLKRTSNDIIAEDGR